MCQSSTWIYTYREEQGWLEHSYTNYSSNYLTQVISLLNQFLIGVCLFMYELQPQDQKRRTSQNCCPPNGGCFAKRAQPQTIVSPNNCCFLPRVSCYFLPFQPWKTSFSLQVGPQTFVFFWPKQAEIHKVRRKKHLFVR